MGFEEIDSNLKKIKKSLKNLVTSFQKGGLVNEAFIYSLSNAKMKIPNQDKQSDFFLRKGANLKRFPVQDILFLQADGDHILIIGELDKFMTTLNLEETMTELGADIFIRVHRSYAVNIAKITEIDVETNIIKISDTEIPLSRRNRRVLFEKINMLP